MAPPGPDVARPALVPLDRVWRALSLTAAGFCLAASIVHGSRDGRWSAAGALAGLALGAVLVAWPRDRNPRVTAIRWADHRWWAVLSAREAAIPATVNGVFALHRGALLRVRGASGDGVAFDELLWVHGPRLEPARWTHLRSTLRLAMPPRPAP